MKWNMDKKWNTVETVEGDRLQNLTQQGSSFSLAIYIGTAMKNSVGLTNKACT